MLRKSQRLKGTRMSTKFDKPIFPKQKFCEVEDYLKHLESYSNTLPVWKDELYLEFHRGCYTTHAQQKKSNRELENLLYEAELFSSIASYVFDSPYPSEKLNLAWKNTLFNQFHDILPGTSIEEVYPDSNKRWLKARRTAELVKRRALNLISSHIDLSNKPEDALRPVVVFNSLSFMRSEVVSIKVGGSTFSIKDHNGDNVDCIVNAKTINFLAQNIPSIGYKLFWLCEHYEKISEDSLVSTFKLENEHMTVSISSDKGEIESLYDKTIRKEIVDGFANEIEFFKDENDYWDAWNINKEYYKNKLETSELESIKWIQSKEIRQIVRVKKKFRSSKFTIDYILDQGSKTLKMKFSVDWKEKHVLVKAAFPLRLKNEKATYDVPCGIIERHTLPNPDLSEHEQAKWEVPALGWADLTDKTCEHGVAILNSCKYGYDASHSRLRVTLLRAPTWPDKTADIGEHNFDVGLYLHKSNAIEGQCKRAGLIFNKPLIVCEPNITNVDSSDLISMEASFFELRNENLILSTLKKSERNVDRWVIRMYETGGFSQEVDFKSSFGLKLADRVNLLEDQLVSKSVHVKPWEIVSFIIKK
jgi:alpha-mannosidase